MAPPPDWLRANREYERVYTARDFEVINGKLWLPIELIGKGFALPAVNVGDESNFRCIAWLDINPSKNPELAQAATFTFEHFYDRISSDFLAVRAGSTKSGKPIDKSVRIYSLGNGGKASIIELPAGANRTKVLLRSQLGTVEIYSPVTGEKFMGRKKGQRERVQHHLHQGKYIVFVDDVWTTGTTFDEMARQLNIDLGYHSVYRVVLAREAELDGNYPPSLPPRTLAAVALPEVTSGLDPKKMFSIADRKSIPRAIVR